ncbi:hypothetical protein LCGC14_1613660 [marine sediment metagenome]|uniref:Uncharacterized protein n=1 Tax=marine sediment metagenome TaxID=412755 RepID=A0A0F9I7J9_9ZZZZ
MLSPKKPKKAAAKSAYPTVTRAQAVRLLALSGRTFDRLVQEGVFTAKSRGAGRRPSTFDAPALVAAYLAHRESRAGQLDLHAEQAEWTRVRREQAEMDRDVRRGELLEGAEVDAAMAEVDLAVRESVLGVAAIAASTGVVAPETEAALDELLRDALRALAGRRRKRDGDRAP